MLWITEPQRRDPRFGGQEADRTKLAGGKKAGRLRKGEKGKRQMAKVKNKTRLAETGAEG